MLDVVKEDDLSEEAIFEETKSRTNAFTYGEERSRQKDLQV